MKEQYRQEMQKIHVPESLLEKTKLAMKAEEQKIKTQKEEKKIIPFGKVSVLAAAAVLMLVLIPASSCAHQGNLRKEMRFIGGTCQQAVSEQEYRMTFYFLLMSRQNTSSFPATTGFCQNAFRILRIYRFRTIVKICTEPLRRQISLLRSMSISCVPFNMSTAEEETTLSSWAQATGMTA